MRISFPGSTIACSPFSPSVYEHINSAAESLGEAGVSGRRKDIRQKLGSFPGQQCRCIKDDGTRCTTKLSMYNKNPEGVCHACHSKYGSSTKFRLDTAA